MKILSLLLVITVFTTFVYAEECKIKGHAIHWAYDYCFSLNETDDSIHPGVIKCTDEAQLKIKVLGECKAKKEFKSLICEVGSYHNGTFKECMDSQKIMGPSVRNNGKYGTYESLKQDK